MQTVGFQFEIELKKRIAQQMDNIRSIVAEGAAVPDWAAYRHYIGKYQGLKLVAETLCDEVSSDINKR